jgi:hypothetical protein
MVAMTGAEDEDEAHSLRVDVDSVVEVVILTIRALPGNLAIEEAEALVVVAIAVAG